MAAELSTERVAERLATLRELYQPPSAAEARAFLAPSAAHDAVPFALQVARRLNELRALLELTDVLHGPRSAER